MWLCQMRVVRKAGKSTCLELGECQNFLCFSLKNGQMQEESLWPKCNCRSLSAKQNFLFPSFQHSSLFSLNLSFFIPSEPIGISSNGTMMWVVCVHVWSLCDPISAERKAGKNGADRPRGPKKTLWDPNSGSGSRTILHHIGSWAVTHPSVCGLGWCGGRGWIAGQPWKSLLYCLSQRMKDRGKRGRERDGRRWGWMREEGGQWLGQERSKAGRKKKELKIRLEDDLTWREID